MRGDLKRILVVFVGCLFLAPAVWAQRDFRSVPAQVIGFEMDEETGVITPVSFHEGQWPNLEYDSEEALQAAVRQTEEERRDGGVGELAVRAFDRNGALIYRGVRTVMVWQIGEAPDGRRIANRVLRPRFSVVVPAETTLFKVEGWLPATRAEFDARQLSAQFSTGRLEALAAAPQRVQLSSTQMNLVVLGDGFQAGTDQLFHTYAQAALQRIFATQPYARYRQFWNTVELFTASIDSGGNHPAACTTDPLAGQTPNHRTAFDASYCTNGIQRLMNVNISKVNTEITNRVLGDPTVILVIVNDPLYGGGGNPVGIASIDPWSPLIALHELGHVAAFTHLADEYDNGGVTLNCDDVNPSQNRPCEVNVTNNSLPGQVKWQRWINGQAQICNPPQAPCSFAVGLYSFNNSTVGGGILYRPQYTCIMREFGANSAFCVVCNEEHIRAFYSRVNPYTNIEHPELSDRVPRSPTLPPADVHVGNTITLGVHPIGLSIPANANPATDPPYQFKWFLNGFLISGATGETYNFSPTIATTSHIEVQVDDPTPMLRVDAAHPKPQTMAQTLGWSVVSDTVTTATSSGTDLVTTRSPVVTVPQGTNNLTLTYTLTTSEPGGGARPGDYWSVTVSYAGASASEFAAAALPFHAEGTITSVKENGTFTVPIQIDATSASRQLVVEVAVKNLETDTFIPTSVSASLAPVPAACGPGCNYCATHPLDPTCPVQVGFQSTQLVPLGADASNRGDSSYFSLGERLDLGRHLIMKMTTPSFFQTLRVVATALAWDGTPLMDVRDVTWFCCSDPRGLTQGLERDTHDATLWDLNISPRKTFPDVLNFPSLTQDQWRADIRYRITATVSMSDGRGGTATADVTNIVSPSTPTSNDTAARGLHALWHTPSSQARWHYWSSVAMNNWLKTTSVQLHIPDRVADEDAVADTPVGHEAGTGITQVPFFPGAGRWDYNFSAAYDAFRKTANAALDGAPSAGQGAARDTVVAWITQTRANLEPILADGLISLVRIGDGSLCGHTAPVGDLLPDNWMRDLLMNGRIIDANGKLLLDVTDRVTAIWNPANIGKLAFDCIDNIDINILLDRCKIGDMRGPCIPGRIPGRRTFIVTPPQSTTIAAGQLANLSVVADGDDLRYQWYVGNTLNFNQPDVGATSAAITVSPSASTSYWVLVTGALGDAASPAAIVTVSGTGAPCNAPPVITQQPPATVTLIDSQTFNATVTATGNNIRYQWYRLDGTGTPSAVPGATQSLFVITGAGQYFVRAYNECGSVDSITINVTVVTTCDVPSATAVTASPTLISPGQPVTLSLTASGKQPVTIIWYQHAPDNTWSSIGMGAQITVTPPIDGTEYFAGLSNACGSFFTPQPIVIGICTPPSIVQQPAAPVFSSPSDSKNIVVVAIGSTLHYAWSVNGASYGSDTSSISITAPTAPTTVSVRVYNGCGSITSNTITVVPPCTPPAIGTQPRTVSVTAGDPATLTLTASGTAPLAIAWHDSGGSVIGTGASITFTPAGTATYTATVTNACGSVTSDPVTVTVVPACQPPAISVQPHDATVSSGQSATLSVTATGTNLQYQWFFGANSTAVPGASASSFFATPPATTTYYVTVSNACGSAQSVTVTVTVADACQPPAIVTGPQSVTVTTNQSVTLTASASGSTPLTYLWYDQFGTFVDQGPSITFSAVVTRSYHAVVSNACGSATTDTAIVTVLAACQAPAISTQPHDVTITSGQSATLSVSATGTDLQYRWYTAADGVPIPGGNASTFSTTPATTTSYYVIVSNDCGSTQSITAYVTVQAACQGPAIVANPQSVTVTTNQPVTLTASASGSAPLTYRWFDQFGTFVGDGPSLSFNALTTRSYYAVVSNACGSAQTTAALVTVTETCSPPSIITDPQSTTINAGSSATLNVLATGTSLTFQWYTSDGSAIGGATSPSLTVSSASTTSYHVRVSNSCGTVLSATATVTVNAACVSPTIVTQPSDVTANDGDTVTLSVTASGNGLTYQWYNGASGDTTAPLFSPGNNTPTVTILANVTTQYWVRVSGTCGHVDSRAATVTVQMCSPATITEQPGSTAITAGSSATLHVSAAGTAPVHYQWYTGSSGDQSSPVAGQTSESITVTPVLTTSFWVAVSNSCSNVSSATAVVTVTQPCTPPSIDTQPQSVTIEPGGSATLSISASGTAPLQIVWSASDGTTAGTGPSITVAPAVTTSYSATVTNACGSVTSSAATVTLNCAPPVVNGIDIVAGAHILHADATGTGTLHYQWYQSKDGGFFWSPVGTDSPYYTYPTPTPGNEESYKVVVTDACGSAESTPVTPPA